MAFPNNYEKFQSTLPAGSHGATLNCLHGYAAQISIHIPSRRATHLPYAELRIYLYR